MNAPRLSQDDVQLEVERIFSKERRSRLTALYGAGDAGSITVRGQDWRIVPTRCELELRAEMPAPGEGDEARKVFLIDWTERSLPLDLGCRLAAGRVFRISRDTLLAVHFGARQAEQRLVGTGLAEVILAGEVAGLKKVSGLTLTREEAYRRFMEAHLRFPLAETVSAATIAAWAAGDDSGPGFVHRTEGSEGWQRLRGELADFVEEAAGDPVARLAWIAWERGLGRRFLELAVLVDAHRRLEDPVAKGMLQGQLEQLGPGFGLALLSRRQELADSGLLKGSLERFEPVARRELLEGGDGLIGHQDFRTTREASPWLPAGHRRRELELAQALEAVLGERTSAALSRMTDALASAGRHQADKLLRTPEQRETRRMAARLAAYLVQRAGAPPAPKLAAAYQAAVDLARGFAAEGGYVDWCRQRLRAPLPFGAELNAACHAVLAAADALRRDDDRRFAAGLVRWAVAGRPATEVTPIDQVTRRLVAELIAGAPGRKLLVVLMDGMSWAAAVQLLARLKDEDWMPIVWRPKGHEGAHLLPPVIAALPTVTPVSRAAFFAGRRDKKAGDRPTSEDAKRWAANRALARALEGGEPPPLVLRRQLMDETELRPELKNAIESDAPVVGVVVNAIDEQLAGSTQVMVDYRRVEIRPLAGLLRAAEGAERIVLLASDHGHVPGDAMASSGQPSTGKSDVKPRWRALKAGEQPHDHEIRLPADTWKPRGSEGVAAIWDEQLCNGKVTYGIHGGVSLAEVVAPAILIAPDWLAQIAGDEAALATRPFPAPPWWRLEARPEPAPARPARAKKAATPLPLFPELEPPGEPETAAPPPATLAPPALVEELRGSRIFKAHVQDQRPEDVDRILGWLGVLVEGGGRLSDAEFARRCETRTHRVAGLVARMGMLNCDGYAMVEHDHHARQVVLHQTRLVQQFGLDS